MHTLLQYAVHTIMPNAYSAPRCNAMVGGGRSPKCQAIVWICRFGILKAIVSSFEYWCHFASPLLWVRHMARGHFYLFPAVPIITTILQPPTSKVGGGATSCDICCDSTSPRGREHQFRRCARIDARTCPTPQHLQVAAPRLDTSCTTTPMVGVGSPITQRWLLGTMDR